MSGMIDPQIFEHLKSKIDEDTKARDDLNGIIQKLERDVSYTQGLLSRVHSTPRSHYPALLSHVETAIKTEADDISQLSEVASQHPYYKYTRPSHQNLVHSANLRFYRYNSKWTRSVQDAILTVLLHGWLGGALVPEGRVGRLLTLEEVGEKVFHGQSSQH